MMITRQTLTQTLIHKHCHICTYPLNIFDIDVSFTLNKLFYNVQMAFFHCHVEGSPLIERRIEISEQVLVQTSQHDLHIAWLLVLRGRKGLPAWSLLCVQCAKHSWKTISITDRHLRYIKLHETANFSFVDQKMPSTDYTLCGKWGVSDESTLFFVGNNHPCI